MIVDVHVFAKTWDIPKSGEAIGWIRFMNPTAKRKLGAVITVYATRLAEARAGSVHYAELPLR